MRGSVALSSGSTCWRMVAHNTPALPCPLGCVVLWTGILFMIHNSNILLYRSCEPIIWHRELEKERKKEKDAWQLLFGNLKPPQSPSFLPSLPICRRVFFIFFSLFSSLLKLWIRKRTHCATRVHYSADFVCVCVCLNDNVREVGREGGRGMY